MSRAVDTEWPGNLSDTHEIVRVHLRSGRVVRREPHGVSTTFLHLIPASDSMVGMSVEACRWREDDDEREWEIEVIPLDAVESIVWRDAKRPT